jgi:signal transduction histidine kinase
MGLSRQPSAELADERSSLARSSRLHAFHWLVVGLSLAITLIAWHVTKRQIEAKARDRFEQASHQVQELITERMRKYEDGLWGGVAAIQANGGDIAHHEWRVFAESLRIDLKYPGINGIGVIHHKTRAERERYLVQQRRGRPDFRIYPEHKNPDLLPISFVEPLRANAKAVGLDIAHETNRYTAALKARDSGVAQITGPIVLVQDEGRTPGFLFYAPFYRGGVHHTVAARRDHFVGMVYAPFVFHKLIEGILGKERRQVRIQVRDGSEVLYDEHSASDVNHDPDPLFATRSEVDLYGRTWTFDIRSTKGFREGTHSSQPMVILLGGLFIDGLLLTLFVLLTRSNRRAIAFADRLVDELDRNLDDRLALAAEKSEKEQQLAKEQAAAELLEVSLRQEREKNALQRQFVSMVSHEFRTPLAIIDGQAQFVLRRLDRITSDMLAQTQKKIQTSVTRLVDLMEHILASNRIEAGKVKFSPESFEIRDLIRDVCALQAEVSPDYDIRTDLDALPPRFFGDIKLLRQVFANLLSNAVKYSPDDKRVEVEAGVAEGQLQVTVRDFGVGIPADELPKIFSQFFRATTAEGFAGTGVGLSLVKTFVDMHGGMLEVESEVGVGTVFVLRLPMTPAALAA